MFFFAASNRLMLLVATAGVLLLLRSRRRGFAQLDSQRRWKLPAAAACLAVAAADPRLLPADRTPMPPTSELVVVVDESASMRVADVNGETRRDAARDFMAELRDRLPAQPIGVVSVGDTARAVRPIERVHRSIEWPDVGLGSDLAIGLEDASDLFVAPPSVRRLLVLVTDGENHGRPLAELSPALTERNIDLFAMIVGTEEGGIVPGDDGEPLVWEGSTVRSRADRDGVAAAGFTLLTGVDALVDDVLRHEEDRERLVQSQALFRPIAAAALMLLLWDALPSLGRSRVVAVMLLACVSLSGQALTTTGQLREGVAALDRADWDTAIERFERAERTPRFADIAAYNLGVALTQSALATGDRERLSLAIDAYRRALTRRPNWPDARRNLQLVYRLSKRTDPESDSPPNEDDEAADGESEAGNSPSPDGDSQPGSDDSAPSEDPAPAQQPAGDGGGDRQDATLLTKPW